MWPTCRKVVSISGSSGFRNLGFSGVGISCLRLEALELRIQKLK